jgi:hypothetical protein
MDEKDPWGPFWHLLHMLYAPGKLVFGRDMLLPIKSMTDWGTIEQQRQKEMGRNNKRENASRISHDYKVGDKILLKKPGKHLRKLEAPRTVPPTVTAIYNNGTVRIQKGKINERVNIIILFPYFEDANH